MKKFICGVTASAFLAGLLVTPVVFAEKLQPKKDASAFKKGTRCVQEAMTPYGYNCFKYLGEGEHGIELEKIYESGWKVVASYVDSNGRRNIYIEEQ